METGFLTRTDILRLFLFKLHLRIHTTRSRYMNDFIFQWIIK